MSGGAILYVHPHGHPEDEVIPYGLVALMNALPGPKLGLFPHELTAPLARGAAAVLMDVHWYHGLAGARAIARELARAAPGVPRVVGGYTASALAEPLVADGVADYVVVGDAERPLPALVERLRDGCEPRDVPNLVARGFSTPRTHVADAAALGTGDYSTLDWFPTLRARVALAHAARPVRVKHPIVPAYKGCEPGAAAPSPVCRDCWGQPRVQRALLGRNLVVRPAESVRAELRRLSADPSVSRVCLFDDPIAMLGEQYAADLFADRLELDLYLEPHRFFSPVLLEHIAASFRAVELVFYHEDLAPLVGGGDARATAFLAAARSLGVRVAVATFSAPTRELEDAARAYGVEILPNADEALELPDPLAPPARREAEYRRILAASRAFGVLAAVARVAPAYLDAVALQLGIVEDPGGAVARLPRARLADRCLDRQNPVERQVLAGANPLRLAFWAAPYAAGAARARAPLQRVPLGALLASPARVEEVGFSLGARSAAAELRLSYRAARAGTPDGIALNFVSDCPGAMAALPYDAIWKLCLPLERTRPVARGEPIAIRVELAASGLEPALARATLEG
jgi:hypothetical protein